MHTCDESCGMVFDPDCPLWRLGELPALEGAALGLEWARRDRVRARALRLAREDPELAEAVALLVSEALAEGMATQFAGAVCELVRQEMVAQLPAAVAELSRRHTR